MLALSEGPYRVGVLLPSLTGTNTICFRKVVFFSYLEFRTMVKVSSRSDCEWYTPSSETFGC
jgi:hypothetical protein